MNFKIIKHTLETTATPAQIWTVWSDVKGWLTWDKDIELCELDGPFQTGITGRLKMKSSPVLQIVLSRVETNKIFVQETKLFLAKNISIHYISQMDGRTQVTFENEMPGPLAFLYAWMIGPSIKKKIPLEMEQMLKKVLS